MKNSYPLGPIEELIILAIQRINTRDKMTSAYSGNISELIRSCVEHELGAQVTCITLKRLEEKEYVSASEMRGPTGKMRRVYVVDDKGRSALEVVRRARAALGG